jgi:SAM-dependent methyltransferase
MYKKLQPIHWLLRIFFHLLYHEMAWTYDFVAYFVSAGLWETWISQALPLLVGPRVLELGHGPGHLQEKMLDEGLNPCGLDRSLQMGKLAQRNIQRYRLQFTNHNNGYAHFGSLVRGNSQSLPLSSNNFQSVVATFPTEYIFDPATLQEIHRVLVPGGRLVILLGAWITGRRVFERAAASLFRLTGQAPEWHPSGSQPIEKAGFRVSVKIQELPSSRLLFLIGEKPR